MHAPDHRYTTFIVVVAVSLTLGCRGSHPFGRFVQITQEPQSTLPEVEPLRQRLATAKPRIETEVTVTTEDDRSQPVDRLASSRTVAHQPTTRPATQNTSRRQRSERASRAPSQPTSNTSSVAKSSARSDTNIKEMDHSELMDAFSDYPPEVQREALRRLLAATARSAEKTSHPAALDAALADNIQDLPELPEERNSKPEVPAKRLASMEPSNQKTSPRNSHDSNAVASNGNPAAARPESRHSSAAGRVSDLTASDVVPAAVQPISDSDLHDDTEVKAASASRVGRDGEPIARAALGPRLSKESFPSKAEIDPSDLDDQALFATLVKRLATAPDNESESERASRLIKLRHIMVLSGDLDAAVQQIEGMSEPEQEFLRHQLLGLWTMVDPDGHPVPSRRITTALPQLREAAKFAAAATDSLEVRSLAFCTEIESYGQIKRFEGNRFHAGQQVILYCEVENFSVKQSEDGYETHLQGSYDIYNANNEKVVSQLLPADKQVSANYLRDYFIAYQMHLPQQLSAGTYRMQLTMEDVNGKKYGQAKIPFEISK